MPDRVAQPGERERAEISRALALTGLTLLGFAFSALATWMAVTALSP